METISVQIDETLYEIRIDREFGGYSIWQEDREVTWEILFAHMPLIRESVQRSLGWFLK